MHLDVVVANKMESNIVNLPLLAGFCMQADLKASNNLLLKHLSDVSVATSRQSTRPLRAGPCFSSFSFSVTGLFL